LLRGSAFESGRIVKIISGGVGPWSYLLAVGAHKMRKLHQPRKHIRSLAHKITGYEIYDPDCLCQFAKLF